MPVMPDDQLVIKLLNMIKKEDRYFSKKEIRKHLQILKGKPMSLSTVYNLISRLRKDGHVIETVYKEGYRYICECEGDLDS